MKMQLLWTVVLFSQTVTFSAGLTSTGTSNKQTAIHHRNRPTNSTHDPKEDSSTLTAYFHYANEIQNMLQKSDSIMDVNSKTFYKNKIRVGRSDDYNEPLPSLDYFPGELKETQCATSLCDCYWDPQINRSNINCRHKRLYSVPPFSPTDTVYYQITFSANNYITRLPYEAFKNLKVERINLLKNKLSSIEPGAFNGLSPYLQELFIEGNGVNGIEIPFTTMKILNKLRRLTVKNFKHHTISEINSFGYFPDLESLEFDYISLSYIDRLAFSGKLTKLLELKFQNVEFTQIPVDSLSFLQSLTKLHIRFTKIKTIYDKSFDKLSSLTDLDLSFNQIETMGRDAFFGISNQLKLLDLSSNKIKPELLVALSSKTWNNLRHLRLSYNTELKTLPANVFRNMPNLEQLFLESTNLVQISRDLFTGLNNLLFLHLGWNSIDSIQDGTFQNMNKLYELNLDFQTVTDTLALTPGAFHGLENSLMYLQVEGTSLNPEPFWSTLKILQELQQLVISETRLDEIPPYAFSENKKLYQIDLNKNGIKNLKQHTFRGLEKSLTELSLKDNNLTTISDCIFKNFTRLNSIRLLRNPLICDCRLKWLHMFITEKSETVPTFLKDDFICSQPQDYARTPLSDIPINDLKCTSVVPERCIEYIYTSRITAEPTKTPTPLPDKYVLKLTILSQTSSSITTGWTVSKEVGITGFKVEYKLTTVTGKGHEVHIHKEEPFYTLHNLAHGSFYHICVTAEINGKEDMSVKDCRTSQTYGQSSGQDEQNYNEFDSGAGSDRNVIIGAVIATIAVVILIAVGICQVVKYKVQSLKQLQLALPVNRLQFADRDDMKVCVVPNEYSEIDVARIANKYRVKCPKSMQRQFGVENYSYDSGEESSPYNTYQKVDKSRQKNPYENDEGFEPVHFDTEKDEVHFKNELEQRHSAPSRLDAAELNKQYDRNSRPLPKTPADQENQKRSSTLKPVKKVKTEKKQILVTQASVYDNEKITMKQNGTHNKE